MLAALTGTSAGRVVARFAGSPGAAAVLCTDSATFRVTKVETSNTLLLVDADVAAANGAPIVARAGASFHYELKRESPDIDLAALLPAFPSRGMPEVDVLASICASPAEARAALRCSGAVEIDGLYSWATADQVFRSLDELINSIALREWSLEKVPVDACAEDVAAHGGDGVLACHCLGFFAVRDDDAMADDSCTQTRYAALDARAIGRTLAHLLFRRDANWEAAAFVAELRTLLPAEAEPTISWFDGIAAVKTDGEGTTHLEYSG
ncbi:sister chromatid cohesion protein Dcc1 [Pelagophyceae sp. CCMP2097]|nr:sister chromatid cohesion protein Dcc1 [Pelagophyceae sp. CCMP2097]